MAAFGHMHNGVVVLDTGASFPEGTRVVVLRDSSGRTAVEKARVEFPLVRAGKPGTWSLTSEQIGKFLDEEDTSAMDGAWNAPPP